MDILGSSLIAEPADMRSFIGNDQYSLDLLVVPEGPSEPKIREAINLLYLAPQKIDAGDDAAVAAYLDSLPPALETLRSNGFEVFAVTVAEADKGTAQVRRNHTHLFVAPAGGYFRISGISVSRKQVHKFMSECQIAVASLADHKTITVWPTIESVAADYRTPVPWCPVCCPGM